MADDPVALDAAGPAAGDAGDAGGLLADAVAELYAGSPEAFTARRGELVASARGAGDRVAARAIGALRRPTRAAWVVNSLVRADPGAAGRLASLGAGLLAAQQAGDGARLRELSAERGPLLDSLAGVAFDAAGVVDPPAGLQAEVLATLAAAVADPEVAAGVAAGTLTQGTEWAGFGPLPPDTGDSDDAGGGGGFGAVGVPARPTDVGDSPAGTRSLAVVPASRPSRPSRAARRRPREADVVVDTAAQERRAEEEAQRLAEEAAERAARQRAAFEESERMVASAVSAVAEALAAEERLEGEVRDLEERLTAARAELAAARVRARRAEAAERRARLTHEHVART